jgi:hypothetical protein
VVKEIGQGGRAAIPVCRHQFEAWFKGGRKRFRGQRLFGGKLGVERPMRQASFLADLRDAHTIDAALAEQMPGRLDQRRAILGGFFFSDLQLILSLKKDLTTKIVIAIIAQHNSGDRNYCNLRFGRTTGVETC